MRKSVKWFIIIFVVLIIGGRYGYVLYGSFGIDADGYTADQKGKEVAYKLHGAYSQAEINQCFRDINIDPDPENLAKLEDMIISGAVKPTPELKKCIEKRVDGYASPKQDLTKAAKAVREITAGEPELIWTPVGEMKYTPNQPGWQTRKITVPAGEGKCRITCVKGYDQFYTDINTTRYVEPTGAPRAQEILLEDTRFSTPMAQLIKVKGITYAVKTGNFSCDTEVEASFSPNMQYSYLNYDRNGGQATFIIEKQMPE